MAKRPKPVPQMTTAQFEARFPVGDDEACLTYLVARRWPEGVHCPRCGNTDVSSASGYKPFHWQCSDCHEGGRTRRPYLQKLSRDYLREYQKAAP